MRLSPTFFSGARFGALTSLFNTLDVLTPEGRAQERQRRIALSALASALAKAISVSTALISVPLALNYLGAERYGMWMAMSSLIAMLSFADLGIGNGLLASVASAHGRDDRASICAYVSSAYLALSGLAFVVLAVFFAGYRFVDWSRIFNVTTQIAREESGKAMAALIVCFALAIPVSVVQRVQMGLQRGFMASFWQCVASLIGLVGVLIAIRKQAPLSVLALAFVGAPLIGGVLNSFWFFLRVEPDIAPSWKALSRSAIRTIAGRGMLFLALQIVAAVAYTSDSLIIAQILGATAVADYAVPEKLFSIVSTILAMFLAPLWPAYGEALARGDRDWVRKILKHSLLFSLGASALCSAILVAIGPWLIGVWVGHAVAPPLLLLLGLGVWKVVESGGNALAMFLNGAQIIGPQLVISLIMCGATVVSKIFLVKYMGVSGTVWATSACFILFAAAPYSFLIKKIMNKYEDKLA
jgi:O-antigen/teichoic acid export membrane protein